MVIGGGSVTVTVKLGTAGVMGYSLIDGTTGRSWKMRSCTHRPTSTLLKLTGVSSASILTTIIIWSKRYSIIKQLIHFEYRCITFLKALLANHEMQEKLIKYMITDLVKFILW